VPVALADSSVWARSDQAAVGDLLGDALDANALAMTGPLMLELLRSARWASDFARLRWMYSSLPRIPMDDPVLDRAGTVQLELVNRGQHRGPSVVDLLTAAAAELAGCELWHCDKHFDHIAAVTGQPIRRVGR
jgi:predicted nucleic acid-binding protein